MKPDGILRWATPAAVLIAGLAVAAALLLRPTPEIYEPASVVEAADVRAVRDDLTGLREDMAKVREDAGRSRCELHRLNEQIQRPAGVFMGSNRC